MKNFFAESNTSEAPVVILPPKPLVATKYSGAFLKKIAFMFKKDEADEGYGVAFFFNQRTNKLVIQGLGENSPVILLNLDGSFHITGQQGAK